MTTQEEEKDKDLERPVSFRLPPSDRAKLMEIAATRGLTAGQLARKIVTRELGMQVKLNHVRTAIANADVLRQLLGRLGALGNNLNQIAAHLNAGGSQVQAAEDFAQLRGRLERALDAVITALKRRHS